MKVLNLYAGIGGNRRLWTDCDVTAVEYNSDIAKVYQDMFPTDTVIVGDAHAFLLEHYRDFDFIWSSPPCPSHSDIRRCGVHAGRYEALYPDMSLYQEIIVLYNFFEGLFVVENVKPYYQLLINAVERGRHLFWANFFIPLFEKFDDRVHNDIVGSSQVYGVSLDKYKINDKRKILRNMVDPELGLHVFNAMKSASCAKKSGQKNDTKECLQTAYNSANMPNVQITLEL